MNPTFDVVTAKAARAPTPTVKPTAAQEKFVRDAMAYLVFRAPFWAHILYNEMGIKYVDDTSGFPVAATDAHWIYVNVHSIERYQLKIPELAFVLAHEVAHYVFSDLVLMVKFRLTGEVICPGGTLPYDAGIMNQAADYRINGMLIHSRLGAMPANCQGLYDPNLSEQGMESCIEIYEKLYRRQGGRGGGGNKPGNQPGGGGHGGFDHHLEPGDKTIKESDSGTHDQAIAAAAEAAKASGKGDLPGCIKRLLGDILEPKVPWQEKLKSSMLRHGGDPMLDWSRPDKRHISRPHPYDPIVFARQAHMGAGTIVIGIDTSGSIGDPEINRFFAETGGIIEELNPMRVIVVWCDMSVHNVNDLDEPEDVYGLRAEVEAQGGPGGGGGTMFEPVFDWVEENEIVPDMLVYLTDLMGSFPEHEPSYPVIWGSICEGMEAPWGEVIEVEL